MISRMRKILSLIGGGMTKDWRVTTFVALATFAGAANFLKLVTGPITFDRVFTVLFWLFLDVFCLIFKSKSFLYIIEMSCIVLCAIDEYSYRSIGIFLLMIYVLTKTKIQRLICFVLIGVTTMISYSITGGNLIDVFAIVLQFIFATFCFYGFVYTRVKDMNYHSKLVYTDDENVVLHALATQDKSQKEVAYELGMQMHEVTYMLNKIKRRNHIVTTDMLLRLYAVELSKRTGTA